MAKQTIRSNYATTVNTVMQSLMNAHLKVQFCIGPWFKNQRRQSQARTVPDFNVLTALPPAVWVYLKELLYSTDSNPTSFNYGNAARSQCKTVCLQTPGFL